MLTHALNAAGRGLHVFPAEPGGKRPHPHIGDWGPLPTGDVATVCAWWRTWPAANIAVACKPSGLLVIDCDQPKKPGDPDGLDEFMQAHRLWGGDLTVLWDNHIVETPSGGLHFYYRWPWAERAQGSKLHDTKNVDIRANNSEWGNYVLGPGSQTGDGAYRVENGREPLECPLWLAQLIAHPPKAQAPVRLPKEPDPGVFLLPGGGTEAGLKAYFADVHPGQQDVQLQHAARWARDEGMDREDTGRLLWDLVQGWTWTAAPWTERDIERHLRQAYK